MKTVLHCRRSLPYFCSWNTANQHQGKAMAPLDSLLCKRQPLPSQLVLCLSVLASQDRFSFEYFNILY